MKAFLFTVFSCLACSVLSAQSVGIGTSNPALSAQLDVTSLNKGLLVPRMTTTARLSILNPAKGLMVYDSTARQFYYHDGAGWQFIVPGSSNASGWGSSNDAHGDVSYKATFPDAANRMVFINSPEMSNNGYVGVFRDGGLNIYNPSNGVKARFLTIDGQGIQSRYQDDNAVNPYEDHREDNLLLNRFGGNVGIGTDFPQHARLEINGAVGAAVAMFGADRTGIAIQANNPEIGFNYYYNGGTRTIAPGFGANLGMSPSNGDVYIGNFNGQQSLNTFGSISGYQYRLIIKQNGNVGIGTTDPTYKLSVNGSIRSKEVVVESGWADYVFDEEYQLAPLADVEKFIRENKRLPKIPSAVEIEKNGLQLGDTQKKMMEKIEELTLYIIQLEKKLCELQNKISQSCSK